MSEEGWAKAVRPRVIVLELQWSLASMSEEGPPLASRARTSACNAVCEQVKTGCREA